MPIESREVRLASRPKGQVTLDNFSFSTVELPEPGPGEVLVRNTFLSVDPYMRGRMNDRKSYVPPFELGKAMDGGAVGRVVVSNDAKMPVGTSVLSFYGWREAFVAPAERLQVVDESLAPASAFLGILGVTGLTAWVGLHRIADIKAGETVFVSAGAGAVGSAACQLAKLHNCKVIASAGSDEKVAWLSNELHVDYAFNYRTAEPLASLTEGAPKGIDVYFDNTGGPQLEAALYAMRERGRIALCGAVAGYDTPVPGPRNLFMAIGKRLRLQGFIITDFFTDQPAFLAEAIPALKTGRLIHRETFVVGLDAAPGAMIDLLQPGAANFGKMIVRLPD